MATIDDHGAVGGPRYSDSYKTAMLALLLLAYTFNFIDRTIISTIGQAIKVDLKLSDTQLGALGGIAFAVLYTSLGIPIARLAERRSRVNIIAISIIIWSGFTAACGAAQNFAQLLLLRVGVGVGEAGLSPAAHSLISDYYEPRRRASALALYSLGIPLGTMFGAVAGGWLTQTFSWRVAFVIVGLPGVLVALAIRLVIKEPPRGHSEPRRAIQEPPLRRPEDIAPTAVPAPAEPWLRAELRELRAVAAILFGKAPVLHIVLGVTIASFATYGAGAFTPPYFLRAFGLDYAQVGLVTGLVAGFSAGIGTVVGGFLTDRLAKRSARWYALVPAIGLTLAAPLYTLAYLQPTWQLAAAILLIPGIFHYTYLGPTFGVVQNMVDTTRRATATALLFFFINLIALGGGPLFSGWLIDQLAQVNFIRGSHGVWASLASLAEGRGGPSFATLCPGGSAPPGAGAELAARCKTALVRATGEGIIATISLYAWAGLHYLLGSIGLTKALAQARVARGEAA